MVGGATAPCDGPPPADGPVKGFRMEDFMSPEWTDEKHMLYLSSIERLFVEQLQRSARASRAALAPECGDSSPTSQFKVLRRGHWGTMRFARARESPPAAGGDGAQQQQPLSKNPWIKRYRSKGASAAAREDGAMQTKAGSLGRDTSADESAEVSDQNFDDEETTAAGGGCAGIPRGWRGRKRSRSSPARATPSDQVVPSGKKLAAAADEGASSRDARRADRVAGSLAMGSCIAPD